MIQGSRPPPPSGLRPRVPAASSPRGQVPCIVRQQSVDYPAALDLYLMCFWLCWWCVRIFGGALNFRLTVFGLLVFFMFYSFSDFRTFLRNCCIKLAYFQNLLGYMLMTF